jgi:hypothetical protein
LLSTSSKSAKYKNFRIKIPAQIRITLSLNAALPLLQSVPIEIVKIGLLTLILNHFRLGHSGFNPHFGLSPTPTRWDEDVGINCEAGGVS